MSTGLLKVLVELGRLHWSNEYGLTSEADDILQKQWQMQITQMI